MNTKEAPQFTPLLLSMSYLHSFVTRNPATVNIIPSGQMVNNLPAMQESLGWEDPLEKEMQPTSAFLPGESHGQRSLVGYSPWGHTQLDMTDQLTQTWFFMDTKDAP